MTTKVSFNAAKEEHKKLIQHFESHGWTIVKNTIGEQIIIVLARKGNFISNWYYDGERIHDHGVVLTAEELRRFLA